MMMLLYITVFLVVWFLLGSWLFILATKSKALDNLDYPGNVTIYLAIAGPLLWYIFVFFYVFDVLIDWRYKKKIKHVVNVDEIDEILDNDLLTDSEKVAKIDKLCGYLYEY